MLKPISQPFCCGALNACLNMQMHLMRWLCDRTVTAVDIAQINLVPPRMPTQIEADWLWNFLSGRKQTRLKQARILADIPVNEKSALLNWCNSVAAIAAQFQPMPTAWPVTSPAISKPAWIAFKDLMEAFYKRGLNSGLPYQSDGTPSATDGVNYVSFVKAFRDAHRQNPNLEAREVCVLCGGPLGQTPEVDHWIAKSAYPLLSVCADNVLATCGECNSSSNKAEKPVYGVDGFADWFHPFFRPANAALGLEYMLDRKVKCTPIQPDDQRKVENLDMLLNLSDRWTCEFKAEYAKQQDMLRRHNKIRVQTGQARYTQAEIQARIEQWKNEDLQPSEPHYNVHSLLSVAMLEKARLAAWETELGLV